MQTLINALKAYSDSPVFNEFHVINAVLHTFSIATKQQCVGNMQFAAPTEHFSHIDWLDTILANAGLSQQIAIEATKPDASGKRILRLAKLSDHEAFADGFLMDVTVLKDAYVPVDVNLIPSPVNVDDSFPVVCFMPAQVLDATGCTEITSEVLESVSIAALALGYDDTEICGDGLLLRK